MTHNKHSVLIDDGPDFLLRCVCGEIFWVDACTEENLRYSPTKKCLIAVCPGCGLDPETGHLGD